jgi:hypothetical protein
MYPVVKSVDWWSDAIPQVGLDAVSEEGLTFFRVISICWSVNACWNQILFCIKGLFILWTTCSQLNVNKRNGIPHQHVLDSSRDEHREGIDSPKTLSDPPCNRIRASEKHRVLCFIFPISKKNYVSHNLLSTKILEYWGKLNWTSSASKQNIRDHKSM